MGKAQGVMQYIQGNVVGQRVLFLLSYAAGLLVKWIQGDRVQQKCIEWAMQILNESKAI